MIFLRTFAAAGRASLYGACVSHDGSEKSTKALTQLTVPLQFSIILYFADNRNDFVFGTFFNLSLYTLLDE